MNLDWRQVNWFSKLLAVGVILLALFLAFLLGISYQQASDTTKRALNILSATTKTAIQTEATTIPGWQTYRSTEYGFELQLPPGWTVEQATQGGKLYFVSSDTKQYLAQNCRGKEGDGCISEGVPFDILFDNQASLPGDSDATQQGAETIGGIKFQTFTSGELIPLYNFEGSDGKNVYHFEYEVDNHNSLVLTILHTFKKIDTQSKKSNVFDPLAVKPGDIIAGWKLISIGPIEGINGAFGADNVQAFFMGEVTISGVYHYAYNDFGGDATAEFFVVSDSEELLKLPTTTSGARNKEDGFCISNSGLARKFFGDSYQITPAKITIKDFSLWYAGSEGCSRATLVGVLMKGEALKK